MLIRCDRGNPRDHLTAPYHYLGASLVVSGYRRRATTRLHRRAQHPWRELGAAEIKTLALGRLSGRGLEDEIENALAALLDALLAFEDGAAIDVHVLFHALVHGRVGRELDRRRRLAPEHAAATRGEADQIGAAGDLPGRGNGIVARRVHEDETLLGDGFGVAQHLDEIGGAGLRHRAERLLQNGGETAGLVARARIGVHLGAFARRVFVPPAHEIDQLLADFAADGAAREQMLGAISLRRLRQDHGAAVTYDEIAGRTQRRIGGNAGIAIRAAALQRHGQFADRNGLAPDLVGLRECLAHEGDAGFHRLAGAADLLDVHRAQAAGELLLLHQAADLVHLAAEAEHDDVGEVHMPRIATERAAEQRQGLVLRHAAAGLMGQRNHAVDIGEVGQRIIAGERIFLEYVGDEACDMRAAIHRGEDADIVARGDAAVRAADAFEARRQVKIRRRLDVGAIGIVLGE